MTAADRSSGETCHSAPATASDGGDGAQAARQQPDSRPDDRRARDHERDAVADAEGMAFEVRVPRQRGGSGERENKHE